MTPVQTQQLRSLSSLRFAALATSIALAGCVERKIEPPPSYETLSDEHRISLAAEVVSLHPHLVMKAAPALRQIRGLLEGQPLDDFASIYMKGFEELRGDLKPSTTADGHYSLPSLSRFSTFSSSAFRGWLVNQPDTSIGKLVLAVGEIDDVCRTVFEGNHRLNQFDRHILGLECFIRETLRIE
jgi:hypothetical protein